MVQKTLLVQLLERAQSEILNFADQLNDADRTTPGEPDHWAARDILAHVGDSVQSGAGEIAVIRRGETPQPGEGEEINRSTYARYQHAAWEEIFTLQEKAFQALLTQVNELTEEELNNPDQFPGSNGSPLWRRAAGTGFTHPLSHMVQNYMERGERDRAARLALLEAKLGGALDNSPRWQGMILYNQACYAALRGEKEQALSQLGEALQLAPQFAGYAAGDLDLVSLHTDPDFLTLLEQHRAD